MILSKQEIRTQLRSRRQNLSAAEQRHASHAVIPFFKHLPFAQKWLLYSPVENEVPIEPLFHWIQSQGGETFFPKIEGTSLTFYRIRSLSELETSGVRKILEPPSGCKEILTLQDAEIVYAIVPGIAFSWGGHRLGFGKGFYDRFFIGNPNLTRIGLAHSFQVSSMNWNVEPHDQRLDLIVTPSGVWGGGPQGLQHERSLCPNSA